MKCVVCRHGETAPGTATLTVQRDAMTLVVRGVPALVWENCGEVYGGDEEAGNIVALADSAAERRARVEVCDYLAA